MSKPYELIETTTVGSATASSIVFSNIPQIYQDLLVVFSLRLTTSGYDTTPWVTGQARLNGSTPSSAKQLYGTGSNAGSDQNLGPLFTVDTHGTASIFSNGQWYIPNYRSLTNKSTSVDVVTENNGISAAQILWAGIHSVTAAVTSITVGADSGNFAEFSSVSLYGIGRDRATGGTITADSLYTYHTFTSSGNFIPLENIKNAEVLVIAGGGGGGSSAGGGGGAGGLAYKNGINFIAGSSYTTTIGAGATATTTDGANGNNGNNSTFMSIVANGGGGGAHANAVINGGSGGGAGYFATASGGSATQTSSSISIGYGNAGGTNNRTGSGPPYPCAGGGGAGSVGGNCTESAGGVGGLGTTLFSSWGLATNTGENVSGAYYYAGGGGGSRDGSTALGGYGGGGRGGTVLSGGTGIAPIAGTANTGGGGGGGIASGNYSGGARGGVGGGSGIVIIRYPNS